MQTLGEIKTLLRERGLRPRHRFGQNFLHDHAKIEQLLEAASVAPGDAVLEVGPGTGVLTEALVEAGARVVACEIDRDLADIVESRVGDAITLVRGDCLGEGRRLNDEARAALGDATFALVANLPYQVASPLMISMLVDEPRCRGQYVTIQREVADRLAARPSTSAYGGLTIVVQTFANVRRIATLPPGCFWPAPKVSSAMVAIEPRDDAPLDGEDRRRFGRFVTELFTKRRKQLGTILGRDVEWPDGVTGEMRTEALEPEQVVELFVRCAD